VRRRIRRATAFALVPLSALPLLLAVPQVAPSAGDRIDELLGDSAPEHRQPHPEIRNLRLERKR
jgi:hypothetical protein